MVYGRPAEKLLAPFILAVIFSDSDPALLAGSLFLCYTIFVMKINFLGTNGWYDSATGNTPCVFIDSAEGYIIFDAGFGLAKISGLLKEDKPIYLFISHFHIDHLCGLHVLPKFRFKNKLAILGPRGVKKALKILVNHPFMMPLKDLPYPVEILELSPKKYSRPFNFSCHKLKHVDECLGYRLKLENKIISYCSDTAPCEGDIAAGKDADLFIHECTFAVRKDVPWAHSDSVQAAEVAKAAGARRLVLTHFGPNSFPTLAERRRRIKEAKKIFPKTAAAVDGLALEL